MNRPGHLLASFLQIGSGSTRGEGEFGTGIGQREECGLWGGNNFENLWHVGNLEPENPTIGVAVGLDQDSVASTSAAPVQLCIMEHQLKVRKRTIAGVVPDLVPVDSGDGNRRKFRKEGRAADTGGDGVGYGPSCSTCFTVATAWMVRSEPEGKVTYPSLWPRGTSTLLKRASEIFSDTECFVRIPHQGMCSLYGSCLDNATSSVNGRILR